MLIVRVLVILVAVVVPAVSTTLAHIDPPDPTWAGGYWDDDDFDYAVDAILHQAAVPPASAPTVDGPSWITIARIEMLEVNGVAPPVPTTDSPRGPPTRSRALV